LFTRAIGTHNNNNNNNTSQQQQQQQQQHNAVMEHQFAHCGGNALNGENEQCLAMQ
jgi:hypothetical protein